MKALVALAIVVTGAVAAFAGHTFGREDEDAPARGVYVLQQGDVARMPSAAAEREATHEAGIPRLFCTRTGASRYQVIINRDVVHVYDLQHPDVEPFEPTYSVPAEP